MGIQTTIGGPTGILAGFGAESEEENTKIFTAAINQLRKYINQKQENIIVCIQLCPEKN